jgi:hypothetical protein
MTLRLNQASFEFDWIKQSRTPNQGDLECFADFCLKQNTWASLNKDLLHAAHHPLPKCLGGTTTIYLTPSQHAAHGVIQSCVYNHPCIWSWEQVFIEHDWPELLDVFCEWLSIKNKNAGSLGGRALSFEQHSAAGKKGGAVTGAMNACSGHWKQCQSLGTKASFKYKYTCLITGVTKYPQHLTRHQRKLGIDTRMRIRLVPQILKENKIA